MIKLVFHGNNDAKNECSNVKDYNVDNAYMENSFLRYVLVKVVVWAWFFCFSNSIGNSNRLNFNCELAFLLLSKTNVKTSEYNMLKKCFW